MRAIASPYRRPESIDATEHSRSCARDIAPSQRTNYTFYLLVYVFTYLLTNLLAVPTTLWSKKIWERKRCSLLRRRLTYVIGVFSNRPCRGRPHPIDPHLRSRPYTSPALSSDSIALSRAQSSAVKCSQVVAPPNLFTCKCFRRRARMWRLTAARNYSLQSSHGQRYVSPRESFFHIVRKTGLI